MDQLPIDAIYENGLFRPLDPVHVTVREGERVRLRIEEARGKSLLDQAGQVYDGLSAADVAEIERIALQRDRFFEERPSE
jgi:predicted DNA-binding antitoxin AbrB/MazE fold protein